MGEVLWHVTMSLDGFIAGPGDAMDWVFEYPDPSMAADDVIATTGALLVGRRTYEVEDRQRGGFYGGAWTGPCFVLTHRAPAEVPDWMTGTFVGADIEDAVARAQAAAGQKNVVILGADVARQCIERGLLDEVVVHVAPVLLGDGVRLFARQGGPPVRLERTAVEPSGQLTALRFRVAKAAPARERREIDPDDLAALARGIVDAGRYMTLGTADESGLPWVSPVWYAPAAYRELFWVSSPGARHSRNVSARPQVSIVIFDSRAPVGTGQGVYMAAVAEELTGEELERGVLVFSRRSQEEGLRAWTEADVTPPARHRLYRATASEHFVLGQRDERVRVTLA
jgi:dihydrofolate reductase/nitroimidazol reductase NimA-like FMN-containing flavoprotein (pyridoxamine 5'-phosphate oxidase superfamily)